MSSLLAYRNYSGIGDWIMALTVLKMVNQQYPEIDIHLNMKAKNLHEYPNEYKIISPFIQEIIETFDVKIAGKTFYDDVKEHAQEFTFISNMKYRKAEKINFIESMVKNFNRLTGLKLEYDPTVYAQYSGLLRTKKREPFLLVQACSKRNHQNPRWKDYGVKNMQQLITLLKHKYKIYQIGGKNGPMLDGVTKHFPELPLDKLNSIMVGCQAFIGLDGMLGVYAAHHAVKQFIIYSGKFNMNWTNFPQRMQINGNDHNPQEISKIILNTLGVAHA